MSKVVAVVIARGGSSRLPNKNMVSFDGDPLVAHKVRQLKAVPSVEQVFVGSDSMDILEAAAKAGATPIKRPDEFCDERSRSWNDVIADMATRITGVHVLWAHCTNPCVMPDTYERAIKAYFGRSAHDSLIGVTEIKSHIWYFDRPLNFHPWGPVHKVAADLTPVYHQNGSIFIYPRREMIKDKYVYGMDPLLFKMDPDEAIDIDHEGDLERAKRFYGLVQAKRSLMP